MSQQSQSTTVELKDLVSALKGLYDQKTSAAVPTKYDGTGKPTHFLEDCEVYFAEKPNMSDEQKVRFVITHCDGKPKVWGRIKFAEYHTGTYPTWAAFKTEFTEAFQKVDEKLDARIKLENMDYRKYHSVNEYNVEFNQLLKDAGITGTGVDDNTVVLNYLKGLERGLATTIYSKDTQPSTLKEWMEAATKIDNKKHALMKLWKLKIAPSFPASSSASSGRGSGRLDEPMDIDAITQRSDPRKCFNCGGVGHIQRNCPSPRYPRQGTSQSNQRPASPLRNQQGQFQRTNQTKQPTNRSNVRTVETEAQAEEVPAEEDLKTRIRAMPVEELMEIVDDYIAQSDSPQDFTN